ncbi:RNA methyltransferase [Pelagibacterales bacterium SAG-MED31]|nr:RNA methyltransferase [Pelagibacterales bacterium SAG-MED31]
MKKKNPTIVLVRPQLSANIGMAARAMDNFGLSNLYIVNPRDGWPNKKAESSSKHADKIINKAKVYDHLEDAVSSFDLVIATSNRKRFLKKNIYDSFNTLQKKIRDFKNTAILFGPENSGLSNEDIRLANFLFTIPTYSSNKSLNLSHAVSVISYELFQVNNSSKNNISTLDMDIVSKFELSNFIKFLVKDLDSRGFFKPIEKKTSMIDNIYSIYNKIDLSKKELRMLWGMHKKLKKPPKIIK